MDSKTKRNNRDISIDSSPAWSSSSPAPALNNSNVGGSLDFKLKKECSLQSASTRAADEDGDSSEDRNDFDEKYIFRNGYFEKAKGLGWLVAGLFVVGDLAGGGIVALPTAFVQSGFGLGILLTIVMTLCATYTAIVIGRCWVIMQRLWPQYTEAHCRKPYPEMGYRALGPRWQYAVSVCIGITQFGISVVYLLLVAKNTHDFLKAFFGSELSFCYIILIVAVVLLPVIFLRSPEDFWGAVVAGMFSTSLAVLLIVLGTALDYPTCALHRSTPSFNAGNSFLALGTFIFSYAGHAPFPTIQHDMRRPHEFTKSSLLAFSIVVTMYLPVTLLAWATYGGSLGASVINSLQLKWIQQVVNMLISMHCVLTLTLSFNPLNQGAEEIFRIPHRFGWQRVAVRTSMMAAVVFVAESVPTFGPVLGLVGGSTLCLTSLFFPCIFYLFLATTEKKARLALKMDGMHADAFGKDSMKIPPALLCPTSLINGEKTAKRQEESSVRHGLSRPTLFADNEAREHPSLLEVLMHTDRFTLFACTFVILVAVLGGGAATFSALLEMTVTDFTPPCYLGAVPPSSTEGHTICCGPERNISRNGPETAAEFCGITSRNSSLIELLL